MTKSEKTKKNITWKLKDLPTAGELADLVNNNILTKEEAREIVLGSVDNDKERIKALESLVDFLQGLVTNLSNKNTTTYIPYHRSVYIDSPTRPYWDKYWLKTDKIMCEAGLNISSYTPTNSNGMITMKIDRNNTSL